MQIKHPLLNEQNSTYLTTQVYAGTGVLGVLNNANFEVGTFVLTGNLGEEQAEISLISSLTNQNIINAETPLLFTHEQSSPVTAMPFNKVEIHKSATKDGVYTLVDTKDIAVDEPFTTYENPADAATDYYKTRFVNPITSAESAFSDPIPVAGLPSYSLGAIQQGFLEEKQDATEKFYKRAEITRWVNDCKNDCFNKLAETNEKHFQGYIEIPSVAGQGEYSLPADFKKKQMIHVSYDGLNFTEPQMEDIDDLDPTATYSKENPAWYFNTYKIGVRPAFADTAGKLRVWYEAHPVDLATEADELPKPLNRYMDMVYDYIWYRAMRKDNKHTDSKIYKREYELRRDEFIEESNNLVLDENRHIKEEDYE